MYILDPSRVTPFVAEDGSVALSARPRRAESVGADHRAGAGNHPRRVLPAVPSALWSLANLRGGLSGYARLDDSHELVAVFLECLAARRHPDGAGADATETVDRISLWWQENFSGDNTGKIAVMADGLHYEPMAVTAERSKLVEQLKMTDEDIAKCYHMPKHKIGIGPTRPTTTSRR